jgi:hypothetical protein
MLTTVHGVIMSIVGHTVLVCMIVLSSTAPMVPKDWLMHPIRRKQSLPNLEFLLSKRESVLAVA